MVVAVAKAVCVTFAGPKLIGDGAVVVTVTTDAGAVLVLGLIPQHEHALLDTAVPEPALAYP